jgi:hypothetical protein
MWTSISGLSGQTGGMLDEALNFVEAHKRSHPDARKQEVQHAFAAAFNPLRARSVFVGDGYSLRFCEARAEGFSNTVLSLSALQSHDDAPFVVVIVRKRGADFLLANSTFLRKVSHSSRDLRVDRLRGSFNGSDILREYEGLLNVPENFDELFAQHRAFSWKENVERLVEATNEIVARDLRFRPNAEQLRIILEAPGRAYAALGSPGYRAVQRELNDTVRALEMKILRAAELDNVNLRGNAIERLITGTGSAHRLEDLERQYPDGRLSIDVKTKLLDRASAPKAYNVDKMLRFLATPESVAAFLAVGIDMGAGRVTVSLLPILERSVLKVTKVQHHWAGRGSRGVTQLTGPVRAMTDDAYVPTVDTVQARAFLAQLVDL